MNHDKFETLKFYCICVVYVLFVSVLHSLLCAHGPTGYDDMLELLKGTVSSRRSFISHSIVLLVQLVILSLLLTETSPLTKA